MNKAKTFQDLIVWQKAHAAVLDSYRLSQNFPKSEIYGLTSQFRISVVSITANIAGGFKKRSHADKARFFSIAQGSLEETRYYLILINDLGYGDTANLMCQLDEVSRLLHSYRNTVRNKN